MGDYTRLNLHIALIPTTPPKVIETLQYMVSTEREEITFALPGHELFYFNWHGGYFETRWHYMFTCSSGYFNATSLPQLNAVKDSQWESEEYYRRRGAFFFQHPMAEGADDETLPNFWPKEDEIPIKHYELIVNSSFKHSREIFQLMDWLRPYVEADGYIGSFQFEGERFPILLFALESNTTGNTVIWYTDSTYTEERIAEFKLDTKIPNYQLFYGDE